MVRNQEEINRKISEALKKPKLEKICNECGSNFQVGGKKHNQKFCSRSCSMVWRNRTTDIAKQAGISSANKKVLRSKNEIMFAEMCSKHFGDVVCNQPMFNGWDADIVILSNKVAVLWNGIWHYQQIGKKQSLKQVQKRDEIKVNEIQAAGYSAYIIKDMGKFNPVFVEEEFQKFKIHCGIEKRPISQGS